MTPDAAISTTQDPASQPPSTAGMTTKVVKGSLWTLAGQVVPLFISLVTTPFVIRMLGSESYGVLILVGLIPTYFAFADLGMAIASTKFGSQAFSMGDQKSEASIVHTAASISFVLSIPIAALIFTLSNEIIGFFTVPEHLNGKANIALKVASITFVITFLNSIYNSPQLARLRMDLNMFVTAGIRIVGLLAMPVVLYAGGDLVDAVVVQLFVAVLTLVTHILVSRSLLPNLIRPSFDRGVVWPMLQFGRGLAIAAVATLLLVNVEKLFLARLESVTALAYYSVAFTFANLATMFFGSVIQSLVPAFSQLSSPEKREEFKRLFERIIRLNVILLFPSLALLALLARPFFTIWAGEEYGRESVAPFYLLLPGLGFNLIANVPYAAIAAFGRSDILAKAYWIQLLFYLLAVYALISSFGISGAASAWSVRMILDACMLVVILVKVFNISFGSRHSLTRLATGGLMVVPIFISLMLADSYAIHSMVSLGCFAAYWLYVWRSVLENSEKVLIYRKAHEYIAWPLERYFQK